MKLKSALPTLLLVSVATTAAADVPARPTVAAVRASKAPAIDADLGDEAWKTAPEITGFTQYLPDNGKPATQNTVVKVVYDDDAIYVGAVMHDSKAVTTLLGRRDNNLESDWFRIYIDSQHDGLTGTSFWVNPANVQVDMILHSDIYDDWSWDAVWSSAAKIVPGGWVVEARIPYSQLRFPEKQTQIWGVNFARRIASNQEFDRLVNTPKSETGFVSRFADLTGIEGIKPERALEVVPYGVARSDLATKIDRANPFAKSQAYDLDGGVDVKYGLSSNLTLTGTINPDFGQVEVDPAVVNLGQFETFFPEKRPFFTEGSQMFRFGNGPANSRFNFNMYPPQFFYSRRIGRAPQGVGNVAADYVDAPGQTTILGAGKLTGKFGKGWSVGVLDAVTDRERARQDTVHITTAGERVHSFDRATVEPLTNYLVARGTKEYGSSRLGLLFTAVNRRLPAEMQFLRANAYTLGADGYTRLWKNSWLFEWQAGATRVEGSPEAIANTQNASAHFYDRPDADYLTFDPTRRSMSGYGGRAMFSKQTGKWRPNFQVQTYSPGFEVNDIGYMQRVDMTATHAVIQYVNEDVRKHVRETSMWVGKYQNWNYGGDLVANGFHGNGSVTWTNYWESWTWFGRGFRALDDRRTRGGPLAARPADYSFGLGSGTDSRKKLSFQVEVGTFGDELGSRGENYYFSVNYRPTTNIRLSVTPVYSVERDMTQYVGPIEDGRRIFSTIDQHTLDIGARIDWTVSSRLSFQLYTQPFIASGDYYDFKELARPRSSDYAPVAYDGNPDFNYRSVRGSAVARWEFRPGSALYVVWNENRSDVAGVGNFRFRRDLAAIPRAPSRDVFLIKVAYWLPM